MEHKQLGVLVQGAGWVSTQHIAAYQRNPHTRIVAISDRSLETARKRAAEAGLDVFCTDRFEEALARPDVDIVSICTPQQVHAEHTIAAARAGKHLLIEKPVAMRLEDLRAMRQAVDAAQVKTVAGFVLRWNPLFRTLKAMSADNAFGRIYSVEVDYLSYSGDWWGGFAEGRTRQLGGSAMLVAGCHALDALRWFAAGGELEPAVPVEVFGYAGGLRGDSTRQYSPLGNTWHDGLPLEYPGLELGLVRFSNGVLGKVSVNFECIQPYSFPIRIFGDRGTVRDNKVWSHKFPGQRDWVELPVICPDSADVGQHPFQGEIDHLVECVLTDRESHCNLADAAKTHEIIFALQRCYATGRPIRLPLD